MIYFKEIIDILTIRLPFTMQVSVSDILIQCMVVLVAQLAFSQVILLANNLVEIKILKDFVKSSVTPQRLLISFQYAILVTIHCQKIVSRLAYAWHVTVVDSTLSFV